MMQLLRRIGFPPFNRPNSSRRQAKSQRRFTLTEQLEPRVLLAADGLAAVQDLTAHINDDSRLASLAIFGALSRGGDSMLAHAGISTNSGTLSSEPVFIDVDGANIDMSEDFPVVVRTLNAVAAETPVPQNAEAEAGDVEIQVGGNTFVIYNSFNGSLRVETANFVTTLEIVSESGIFTGEDAVNLGGTFDIDSDNKIFKLVQEGFLDLTFGQVAQTGLTEEFIRNDLTINGSVAVPDPEDPNRFIGDALSNKTVKLRLQVTDPNGVPINEVSFNDEFLVRVITQDKRPFGLVPEGNEGVFSAYMDIIFDANLAVANGSIRFSDDYRNATSGTISPGLIDEIGAVSTSSSPLDQTEFEVAVIPMRAIGAGQLTFIADAADLLPNHQTLVFGGTASVDPLDIEFVDSQTVTVTDTPTAPDLVQFAKDLAASGAIMYGAGWCPACTAQKELFEDGQLFLPFVEVTNPDRTPNAIGIAEGIESYPTWVFDDGTPLVGGASLETLADRAGISIPQSNAPTMAPIEDVTLLGGSPLHLALDGYDPNGGPLTYSITTDNPDLVMASLLEGNRSMRISVGGFGDMVFQLFDDRAPRVTEQITTLAEDGFYDGLTFHRVINNFVIQGGDPLGTGTGGSDLPDFDDQFHVDLQHNRTGILSMAKSADDTNNSQFFITEGTARHLDFNHSIFGQLVEGESNRDNISNTAVGGGSRPTITVTMNSVDIFDDIENGLLMLKAAEGASGSANVTVNVEDAEGHSFEQTFAVDVEPDTIDGDTIDGGPFLDDIPTLTTSANTPFTYQLTAQDVEGDDLTFSAGSSATNATADVDSATGLVTITPDADFVGTATVTVRVRATVESDTADTYDTQLITVEVLPAMPNVDLLAGSDSGSSSTDNLTNLTELQFQVTNVADGALVEIFADGDKIGEGSVDGNSVVITTANLATFGDGVYEITATQTVDGTTSAESAELIVELDQMGPDGFASTPPDTLLVGSPIDYDVEHDEEGDIVYSLSNAPDGASIDPASGVLSWTPISSQAGRQSFQVVATDAAGNSSEQIVDIDVEQDQLMRFRLEATNLNGNPVNAVIAGEEFQLQVFVQDLRDDSVDLGVFSAYLDIVYDDAAVSLNGEVQFSSAYGNVQFLDTDTPGLIDDTGATADTAPLGGGEFLLMTIPMIAVGSGETSFTGNPADELPSRETTLHGLGVGLRDDQMIFDGTSLRIVSMTFANDDEFQVLEDSTNVSLNVLANDLAVPAGRTLTITDVSGTSNATVSVNDDQVIVYTPNANFAGTDSFTYEITDNEGDSSTATVTVQVTNVNDDPVANDDSFSLDEDDTAVEIRVLANDDISPDADETLTVTNVTQPQNGSAQVNGDGSAVLYTPAANFSGSDSFTYTISDGNGGEDQATVEITVADVNDAPIVFRVIRGIDEDTTLSIDVADLLAGALPGGGETDQTLSLVSVDGATAGTLQRNGDVVTFTPPQDFTGTLTFDYTVTDDGTSGGVADPRTATGIVTVNVNAVNDNPTAVDDTATAQTGAGSITIFVLNNDSIAPDDDELLSVISVSEGSAGGTINIVDGNAIEYTPSEDFTEGSETFTYTISDGNGGEDTATVTVEVLNFVPGGISGSYMWAQTRLGFAGLPILISGIDNTGNAVDFSTITNADGDFFFDTLSPGNYELRAIEPSFTVKTSSSGDGSEDEMFMIELTAEGVADTRFNFSSRILDPRFSIWDALSSRSDTGFYASVHEVDGHEWTQFDDGWEDVEIVDVQFTDDTTSLNVVIIEDGQQMTATVPRSDRARVQLIGQKDDYRLIRINGSRDDFDFQPSSSGAEGESARDQLFAEGLL